MSESSGVQFRANLKVVSRKVPEELLAHFLFPWDREFRNISLISLRTAFVYIKSLIRTLQATKSQTTSYKESQILTPTAFHHLAGQIPLAYFEQELLEEAFSMEQNEQCLVYLMLLTLPRFSSINPLNFSSIFFLLYIYATHCLTLRKCKVTRSFKPKDSRSQTLWKAVWVGKSSANCTTTVTMLNSFNLRFF